MGDKGIKGIYKRNIWHLPWIHLSDKNKGSVPRQEAWDKAHKEYDVYNKTRVYILTLMIWSGNCWESRGMHMNVLNMEMVNVHRNWTSLIQEIRRL